MNRDNISLPQGWAASHAVDLCEKIQDGTHFSPKVQLPEGRYRYVTAKNVRSTGLDLTDIKYLTPEDHRSIYDRCDTRKGDVLLVKDGVNTGDVAMNTLDDEISLLSSVCFLRPDRRVLSPPFLRYFLMSPAGQSALTGRMTGTAIKRIVLHRIKETRIDIAPLTEQERIVDALDGYISRLDNTVASLERVQAKLKAYRAAVLKAAVEGRLVPTEASLARAEKREYEPANVLLARILKERRREWEKAKLVKLKAVGKMPKDDKWKAKYEEPAGPDTTRLPELPEGWCWASPEQLSSTDSYSLGIGPFGSNLKVTDYTDHGIPLVFVRNIRSESFSDDENTHYVSLEKARELRPHQVAPGDILVTKMGDPPGDCCLYPLSRPAGVITADCIKLRLHANLHCVTFFVYAMRSGAVQIQIHGMTKGVAQKKVSLARFRRLALPLPPAPEQQRIADKVETFLSVADQMLLDLRGTLRRCARLRQQTLKWAFEGKLVDQDPTDEPADKLLARIRAQRAAVPTKKGRGRAAKGAA